MSVTCADVLLAASGPADRALQQADPQLTRPWFAGAFNSTACGLAARHSNRSCVRLARPAFHTRRLPAWLQIGLRPRSLDLRSRRSEYCARKTLVFPY